MLAPMDSGPTIAAKDEHADRRPAIHRGDDRAPPPTAVICQNRVNET
jgi:hypothetical protein